MLRAVSDTHDWPQADGRTLHLLRGARRSDGLRAWDAADGVLAEHDEDADLLVGDRWGALVCALGRPVPVWSDHAASWYDIRGNQDRNDHTRSPISAELPDGPHKRVLMRIPRATERLDDWLTALAAQVPEGGTLAAAGMAQHVPRQARQRVEALFGPVHHSRGHGKARLILATRDHRTPEPVPLRRWLWPETEWPVLNAPGVFSGGSPDPGTRTLLSHLPPLRGTVLDLGCGNGVLGLAAAHRNEDVDVVFVDSDMAAIRSARATWDASGLTHPVQFFHRDVLSGLKDPVDVVLCNPPFHEGGAQTSAIAARMFAAAASVLTDNGVLAVVANRHLGHDVRLGRHFDDVQPVSRHPRFVVLHARGPRRR